MPETTQIAPSTIKRVNGNLYRITHVLSKTGKIIHTISTPLMVELKPRDILQIILGASILAVPVGFTEEVWQLGSVLPLPKIIALTSISLLFIGTYVYFNFYRNQIRTHFWEYIKRVLAIYVLSFLVVGILLTIIEVCPWGKDNILAIKRIVLVSFPASMSAALSDSLK